jgi:hypothetical protein
MSQVYAEQGDLVKATKCYEDALKIDEKTFGMESAVVAADHEKLADLYSNLKEAVKAGNHLEQAKRIMQSIRTRTHRFLDFGGSKPYGI